MTLFSPLLQEKINLNLYIWLTFYCIYCYGDVNVKLMTESFCSVSCAVTSQLWHISWNNVLTYFALLHYYYITLLHWKPMLCGPPLFFLPQGQLWPEALFFRLSIHPSVHPYVCSILMDTGNFFHIWHRCPLGLKGTENIVVFKIKVIVT